MRITSDFENKVLIQKSKRELLLKKFLSESPNDEKIKLFKSFLDLHLLMHHYLIETNRFTIILDTNVIQDILSSESNRSREILYFVHHKIYCITLKI